MLRYSRAGVVKCWSIVPLCSHGDSAASEADGLPTVVGEPVGSADWFLRATMARVAEHCSRRPDPPGQPAQRATSVCSPNEVAMTAGSVCLHRPEDGVTIVRERARVSEDHHSSVLVNTTNESL